MRSIRIYRREDGKYVNEFVADGVSLFTFIEYTIISHEIMVDWIEFNKLPTFLGT